MTPPTLHVLGRVAVAGPDGPRGVQVGHAASILALLAAECGRVVSFDRLVHQLWGDHPPPSVRSTVYANVSRLRRALEHSGFRIESRAPGYVLDGPREAVDAHLLAGLVDAADELAAAGTWDEVLARTTEAAELGRRTPFEGAVVREDLAHETERLAKVAERAEELRAEALLHLGRVDEAARHAAALVARDPFDEAYWRLRMRAEHAEGRTAAALATFTELRGFLGDELGIDPGEATRELHLRILRSADAGPDLDETLARADAAARAPSRPWRVETPVGRAREVELLDRAVEEALTRTGRVVLIEGEAGIGKTRLAEYAADRAAQAGAVVVWARATAGPGTPALWVWESALRDLGRHDGDDPATAPIDLRPDPGLPPEEARFRVHQRIADCVLAVAERHPVVVVLDDLQWADDGSRNALAALAHRVRGHRCLVVATSRPREAGASDPLARLVGAQQVDRWTLEPFDVGEVLALVERWRDRLPSTPVDVDRLRDRTGGNPFLLTEVLRDGAGDRVPATVGEIVARRLASLPDPTRTALELAAVAGRRLDPPVLAEALVVTATALVAVLEPARAEGLVVSDQATRALVFGHDLAREAIVAAMPADERIAVHARLAEAIATVHADDLARHLDELADHRFESAAGAPHLGAYETCMAAADLAAARHAYDQAALQRHRALLTLVPGTAHRDVRFEVLFELAAERRLAGDALGAAASLDQALDLAGRMGDHVLLRRALALLGDVTLWNWRQFGELHDGVVAALEEVLAHDVVATRSRAMPPAERARILGTTAVELYYGDARGRSEELALEALDVARGVGDPALLGRVLNNVVIASWFPDRDHDRLARLDESLRMAGAGLPEATEAVARLHRGPLRLQAADATGFVEDLGRAERLAARLGRPELEAQVCSQWMGYHLLCGDLDAARRSMERMDRTLRRTSIWGGDWVRLIGESAMARVEGTFATWAGTLVDRADEDPHGLLRWTAMLAVAEGGDHRGARDLQARWGLSALPQRTFWGSALEWTQAAELALLLGSPDRVAAYRLLAQVPGPLVLAGTAVAVWGPVDALRARLADAVDDPEAADHHRAVSREVTDRLRLALGVDPVFPLG